MTVVKKSDSPSTNVTLGASDQNLATYTFTAYGEAIKVETLNVGMITTGGTVTEHSLRNVRILVNGAQVGSNTTVPAAGSFATATGTAFTTNFVVYPGTPAIVEIHSDIYDNEGTDNIAAGTVTAVQALLVGGASANNAIPQTSLGTLDVPSADNVLGNTLTISSGTISLSLTGTYANQITAVPTTAYKIGSYKLFGNSTEAVNLNTIYVGWSTGTVVESTSLADLYVVYGGTTSPVKGTVVSSAVAATVSDNSNSWSINRVLAKNETMQIDVYATLAASVSTDTIISTLAIAGTTASSGIAVYADATANSALDAGFVGQTITGGTGSLTATADASRPDASLNDDTGTKTMAAFKFVAITDSYTVTDLTFTVPASGVTVASSMELYDGGTLLASKPVTATTVFSGLSWPVLAGQTKVLTVKLVLGPVGTGAGSTGASTLVTLTAGTRTNSAGTSTTITESDPAGYAQYVYKSVPTLALVALPTSALAAGTNTLYKFSVNTSGTGTIGWNRMIFSLTKTSVPVIANGAAVTLWNADTNTQIGGTADIIDSANAATCIATLLTCRIRFLPTAEQQIAGSVNYVLKADVTGAALGTGDYISTRLAAPSVFAASDDYTAVAASGSFAATYAGYGTSPSFIWSDVSGSGHDAASVTVTDWSNEFLVKSLPLDSQTVTK